MRLTMFAAISIQLFAISTSLAQATQTAFEVASVRPSQHEVGPDYNNQITYSPEHFVARNVTLKRLIAEAWRCQINQVIGPAWIEHNEYDVEARIPAGAEHEQVALMLRSFLVDRFHLKEHGETRQMRVYELTVGEGGAKIQPFQEGKGTTGGPGFPFHGDMRQFADLLAVQFSIPAADNPNVPSKAGGPSIPVLDKTGLKGVYDFNVDVHPELGTDAFTSWKRALKDQLGLKIESQKSEVRVVVVEDVAKIPTAN